MLHNYLILALRTLRKTVFIRLLMYFGLAIGVAACLLLFRLVYYELSFDTYHRQYDRMCVL